MLRHAPFHHLLPACELESSSTVLVKVDPSILMQLELVIFYLKVLRYIARDVPIPFWRSASIYHGRSERLPHRAFYFSLINPISISDLKFEPVIVRRFEDCYLKQPFSLPSPTYMSRAPPSCWQTNLLHRMAGAKKKNHFIPYTCHMKIFQVTPLCKDLTSPQSHCAGSGCNSRHR